VDQVMAAIRDELAGLLGHGAEQAIIAGGVADNNRLGIDTAEAEPEFHQDRAPAHRARPVIRSTAQAANGNTEITVQTGAKPCLTISSPTTAEKTVCMAP